MLMPAFLRRRISSYTWKSAWGPDYHPSMFIGIAALAFATCLAFGKQASPFS